MRFAVFAALIIAPGATLAGQERDSTRADSVRSAPAESGPKLDFSGVVFANYQYRTDAASRDANKFDVERAYLTFRVPAGNRASVRLTADVYQAPAGSDAFYRGWALRAKYAYLQYNYLDGSSWKGLARIGLIQTVFVEQDEQFWPRWISNTATERAGYFSSADAGLATSVSLPRKFGELYAGITNGPGYTSREIDRFKDFSGRLTLTPWSAASASPFRSVALSLWGYKGALASRFASGGDGQVGPVGDALERDRWGVHVGATSPRLIFGVQYASRTDAGESGANTAVSPRVDIDSTGTLRSAYAIARPVALAAGIPSHPLGILARWDRVETNTVTGDEYDFVVAGIIWDLSSKVSAALDYQEASPVKGRPVPVSKVWFVHFTARF